MSVKHVYFQEINDMNVLLIKFGYTVVSHFSVKFAYKLDIKGQKWRKCNGELYSYLLHLSDFVSGGKCIPELQDHDGD
jgi:hypothetical protein